MRIVVKGNSNIIRLLGKQHIKDTKYRLMNYLLFENCKDGILIHNVITGQLALLNQKEATALHHLPDVDSEVLRDLIEGYFLVPEDYDEKDTVDKLRVLLKSIFRSKGINNYLILTTTNCNARCFYCFENGMRHVNMDSSTAEQVIDFITTHNNGKTVNLHWFGGEPLLYSNRIDQICRGLRNQNVVFRSVMTSNGYLFSEERANRWVRDWNLQRVQITLDGTEETYNRVKSYVSISGSPYQRVMNNVHHLLKAGTYVVLRLSLNNRNGDEIKELIDEIYSRFAHYNNLSIYVSRIIDELYISGNSCEETANGYLDNAVRELNEYIDSLSLHKKQFKLLSLKTNSCMADSDEATVILPDGMLCKCENVSDEDVYGSIYSKEMNSKRDRYKQTLVLDRCRHCPLYPSCIILADCPSKKHIESYPCQNSIKSKSRELVQYYNHFCSN